MYPDEADIDDRTLCRGCGKPLLAKNYRIADGCPCNSPRGVNHGVVPTLTCTCSACDPGNFGSTRWPVACAHDGASCGPGCPCTCTDCTVARLVRERDEARNHLTAAHRHIDLLTAVVKAARLFRKADTGGSFNDRVECGALLDDKLAALDR